MPVTRSGTPVTAGVRASPVAGTPAGSPAPAAGSLGPGGSSAAVRAVSSARATSAAGASAAVGRVAGWSVALVSVSTTVPAPVTSPPGPTGPVTSTRSGSRAASSTGSRVSRAASSRDPGEKPCQTTAPNLVTGGGSSPSASDARAGPRSRTW